MPYLGAITVRTLSVGGAVADAAALKPGGQWLHGHRHVVLLVHGFNVSEEDAVRGYGQLFDRLAADVVHVLWPGDARGGSAVSTMSYPFQIRSARDSAARLADLLRGLFGPEGGPAAVSLIGHSLGCRLVLELLRLAAAAPGDFPRFDVVALMAAAVPVALVDQGGDLEPAARSAGKLALLYSRADSVLQFAFPAGQTAARLLGEDVGGIFAGGNYSTAVGRAGEPAILTWHRGDMAAYGYGHGSYWGPGREALEYVAPLLGIATPRLIAARGTDTRVLAADTLPAETAAAVPRPLPSRTLTPRRLA